MACSTMAVPASPDTKDIFKEHSGLRRSLSGQDLVKGNGIRRSYSDNQLCYSINRSCAVPVQMKLNSSGSVRIFPFQISSSIIPNSLKSLLFVSETSQEESVAVKDTETDANSQDEEAKEIKRVNWVERMLEIRRQWKNGSPKEGVKGHDVTEKNRNTHCDCDGDGDGDGCPANYESDEERHEDDEEKEGTKPKYDRESFSKLLVKVSWSETKQFSRLAFLCNKAYVISEIKAEDLRRHGLKFVTSSLEKKAKAAILHAKLEQDSNHVRVSKAEAAPESRYENAELEMRQIRSSAAYKIAASAASYVKETLQETDDVEQRREEIKEENPPYKSAVAAQAAASTMTAVVAAGEREKEEAAKDLQSLQSSPCEWFVCDDPSTYTRCFVIQGSDSLASWQANLFFEPTKFEGTDVLVHRGIYEAAKGIYEQFMPEIAEHLSTNGDRAKFKFTGHSLGGSLSLMVNLMLITRKVLKASALRPVVTFGSPFVFCGGQRILNYLGLDESSVHCVMMHRDIVPRAFSCNYPDHVALVLKRLNGAFRSHPCLNKNKLLYSPLGKVFVLQPSERSSPPHPLLPPGNALYALDKIRDEVFSANALRAFLNCPHPLETLSNPTAYGSEGSILRDHDSSNYVKAVNGVLRQYTKLVVRKVRKERQTLWPLLNNEKDLENNRKEIMTKV